MLIPTLSLLVVMSSLPPQGEEPVSPASPARGEEAIGERIRERGEALLQDLVERGLPGVSAALVLPGGQVVTVVVGMADEERQEAMTDTHRLLSGSVGKTYVTASAHRLIEAGILDLEETASHYLGEEAADWLARVPNGPVVTLRQLLRHQSGVPRYVFKPEFTEALGADLDRRWLPKDLVEYVFDDPPMFAPGERFAYSDTNYILVGMVIEEVTGEAFYDYVSEHFLNPHTLAATVPSDRRQIPKMAQGTVVLGKSLGVPDRTLVDGVFAYNPQFEWCGGGWACTPADLARWTGILYSGGAMEGPYLDTLLDGVLAPELGRGMKYGLGAMMTETSAGMWIGHDGFMPGYLTTTAYFPESGLAGTIQLNSDDMRAVGRRLSSVLVDLVSIAIEELGAGDDR